MTDQPAQPACTRSPRWKSCSSTFRIRASPSARHEKPVKVNDERVGVNGKVALIITAIVGTMWCAYIFAVIGLIRPRRRRHEQRHGGRDRRRGVAQYFLQLVLLPIIIVGQNIQGKASDKRSEQTYKDAEAILSECLQLQQHLQAQDTVLDDVVAHVKQHHEELQRLAKLAQQQGPATA